MSVQTLRNQSNPISGARSAGLIPSENWTDVKIKRLWASVGAALCFTAASVATALVFTATPLYLLGALPLFLAAGILVWYYWNTVDYRDPKELAALRHAASAMPLPQVVEKHGWENLILHQVLSPVQFEQAFAAQAEKLDMLPLLAYHTEAAQQLRSAVLKIPADAAARYKVPALSLWREKYRQETAAMSFHSVLTFYRHHASQLFEHGILSLEEYEIFRDGHNILDHFSARQEECGVEFSKQTVKERQLRNQLIQIAVDAFHANPAEKLLAQLFSDYTKELDRLRSASLHEIAAEQQLLKTRSFASPSEEQEKRKESERKCKQIESRLDWDLFLLKRNYELKQASLRKDCEDARTAKELAIRLAEEQYAQSTKPFGEEADRKVAAYAAERDLQLAALKERHEAFRRADRR